MNQIAHARFEVTGTASYEFSLDVANERVFDDDTWPDIDNSDTEVIGITLVDGETIDVRTPDGRARVAELFPDQDVEDVKFSLWEQQFEAAWPTESIHDLFKKVREHPDFRFGTIFVAADIDEEGSGWNENDQKHGEEHIVAAGFEYLREVAGSLA